MTGTAAAPVSDVHSMLSLRSQYDALAADLRILTEVLDSSNPVPPRPINSESVHPVVASSTMSSEGSDWPNLKGACLRPGLPSEAILAGEQRAFALLELSTTLEAGPLLGQVLNAATPPAGFDLRRAEAVPGQGTTAASATAAAVAGVAPSTARQPALLQTDLLSLES